MYFISWYLRVELSLETKLPIRYTYITDTHTTSNIIYDYVTSVESLDPLTTIEIQIKYTNSDCISTVN